MSRQIPSTAATKYIDSDTDDAFASGASRSINRNTSGSGAGNTPETIKDRTDDEGFGDNQPIRKGVRYKFIDAPENHPRIPKSSQKEFTQEVDAIPTAQSGDTTLIPGIQNKKV